MEVISKPCGLVTLEQDTEYRNAIPKFTSQLEYYADNHFGRKLKSDTAWLRQVIEQNLNKLSKKFGVITLAMGNALGSGIPESELQRWYEAATIVDMNQAGALLYTKILNESKLADKELKQPAWHCISGVGMNAINDAFLIQMDIHNSTKLIFNENPELRDQLEDLVRETHEKCVLGKAIEERMKRRKNLLESYTEAKFRLVINLKLNYYRFYKPMAVAWILKGKWDDPKIKRAVKWMAYEIGYYVKLGEDFEEISSKSAPTLVGEPLSKLTWPFVRFLEQVGKTAKGQEQILELVNYLQLGEMVKVRRIYEDMGIHKQLLDERQLRKQRIRERAHNLPEVMTRELNNLDVWNQLLELP